MFVRAVIFKGEIYMQSLTEIQRRLNTVTFLLMLSITVTATLFCNKTTSPVFGTYKMYSDDPALYEWMAGENTYLKLNTDKTIVYNSTINGKQKFHFEGNFTLDEGTNELTIQWKQGTLPSKLQVQKIGGNKIILVGITTYKKQGAN
jgi:hypothetical protein